MERPLFWRRGLQMASWHCRIAMMILIATLCRAENPVIFTPEATFDLADGSSQAMPQFSAIALGETGVFAVRRTGTRLDLLQANRLGSVIAARSLDVPGSPLATSVDKEGRLSLLVGMRGRTTQLHQYTVSGDHRVIPLKFVAIRIAVGPGGIVLLSSDGTAAVLKETGSEPLRGVRLPPDSAKQYELAVVDTSTLAIVQRYTNELRLVNLQTGAERVVADDAPELKESVARLDEMAAGAPKGAAYAAPVLFHAAASDCNSNLFLGVSPGSVAEGMRVVQLDREGRYVRSLRLKNRNGPRLRVQRHLAVATSTMATLSEDGVVSLFRMAGATPCPTLLH